MYKLTVSSSFEVTIPDLDFAVQYEILKVVCYVEVHLFE